MCDLSIGSTTLEIYRKLYINHYKFQVRSLVNEQLTNWMKTVKTHHSSRAIFKGHLAWHWTLWAHSSPFDLCDLNCFNSNCMLLEMPQVHTSSRDFFRMAWELWSLDTRAHTHVNAIYSTDKTRTEGNTVPSWHKPVAGKIIWTAIEHSLTVPFTQFGPPDTASSCLDTLATGQSIAAQRFSTMTNHQQSKKEKTRQNETRQDK